MGMARISPRFTEYGRFKDTKNGWKTSNLRGVFVIPKPLKGSTAKAVIIQEVIVSGTFFVMVLIPSTLQEKSQSVLKDLLR